MSKRRLDRITYGVGQSFSSDQYLQFADYEIEIMYQPLTIKKFIIKIQKIQSYERKLFYPVREDNIKKFFNKIKSNFDYNSLKYNSSDDTNQISNIISFLGESGHSYFNSVKNVGLSNQPTLLFYGLEQLATFFSYTFFNFSQENSEINQIRGSFRRHGIDPYEFNSVTSSITIDEILTKKIKLLDMGAIQRFFLVLGFPIENYFFKEFRFRLLDLLYIFFTKLRISLGNELTRCFLDDFELYYNPIQEITYHQDLDLLIFYCLSFLFSHLSRYKISLWQKILRTDEKNLGFYIKFIIRKINDLFIRKIFSILKYEKDQVSIFLRHPDKD
jgi:hypothetical protein